MPDADLIVVGAGPVGMLAALLAAEAGLSVVLLEQSAQRHAQSRALGIMPPSLEILGRVGLASSFVSQGVAVRIAEAFGGRRRLGHLDFSTLGGAFPFVLSLPQNRTEALLEEAVLARSAIRLLRGHRAAACAESSGGVRVSGREKARGDFHFTGRYALACDGGKSTLRQALGIPFEGAAETRTFLLADFIDTSGWGMDARFFLTPHGSVESFPLPGGNRRYVLRTPFFIEDEASDYLRTELLGRAGIDVGGTCPFWESSFSVRRSLARSFSRGRVFLCGDAAHLMSPVGGQNMNTGFADAELAVWLVKLLIDGQVSPAVAARHYQRVRRRAACIVHRRARLLTLAGTSGGQAWSTVRNGAVFLALHSPMLHFLTRSLSMQTLPFRNLAHCRSDYAKELGIAAAAGELKDA